MSAIALPDTRGDWLACPYRILDQHFTLLAAAIRTVRGIHDSESIELLPVSVLEVDERRKHIIEQLDTGAARVFLFTANKLGGELDIPETDSSPGGKVDFSVMEVTAFPEAGPVPLEFGKVMMFEVQTADFHGSPKHAEANLVALCPPGHDVSLPYHDEIRNNPELVGDRMEGPNKANIFKRTIYQMLYKMELARAESCDGFVIVLPAVVWTSWLRHLGMPPLTQDAADPTLLRLEVPEAAGKQTRPNEELVKPEPAWIFVFDIDRTSHESPNPLRVVHRIATDSASLIHFAFEEAARKAIRGKALEKYREAFINRIMERWTRGAKKK